jgi:Protein of unknown function (DUF6044)
VFLRLNVRSKTASAWAVAAFLFYLPLLIPSLAVVEPDDLLDSELVYNHAIGALWRGDASIAHAFLVGHVPVLALSRLTQPLMALYALLPPLQAYVLNDFVVRAVAALGSWLLLGELRVAPSFRHLLAALFAVSLTNTTYGLSIAGLPACLWLLSRPSPWRLALIAFIGWNSSVYLSGIFFLAAAPFLHRFILEGPIDRRFAAGWLAYAAGLLAGNAGLIWLALAPHPIWHRVEWAPAPPAYPFSWKSVARPLLPLFALAALLGFRDRRAKAAIAFGLFIIAWYALDHVAFVQLHVPGRLQIDRFYFLWPLLLLLLVGLASIHALGWQRPLLFGATAVGLFVSLTPQQHLRQLAREAVGHGGGYPPVDLYYHTAWFRSAHLDGPVVSVGLDPMAAPMNGVPSIDGYFPLYPLAYKHAFQRVNDDWLIRSWGSKLYATPASDFCAARRLGARYAISPLSLPDKHLQLVRTGELNLYRIAC